MTLDILDADGVTVHEIAHLRALAAKEIWLAVQNDRDEIVLLKGEKLRALASAASQLHVTGFRVDPPN